MLEVKNLKKGFGGSPVLKGVSFSLEAGQVLAIIGSSGSGKSTLLQCLNFLEAPEAGEILVNGESLLGGTEEQIRQARLNFGLVFQSFHLFPQYTVLENITLAPRLLKKAGDIEQNALALLEQVGLLEKRDAYPWQLSGGQQQRVAIARALALRPKVLCFDEPTSALDPELTGEVLRVIRSLKDKKTTMIVVTHEMAFAKSVADVVIYMADGVIEEMGSPDAIFGSPRSQKTRAFVQGASEQF
ncbi:MAG TPA: amino acid ABC transporter ATP-binding protein [Candidatus Faecousia intestinigallinarum]|nr:amino acid ABC transporter ATP-binding protein [Candidatus Faecousia intestinigallinarum]